MLNTDCELFKSSLALMLLAYFSTGNQRKETGMFLLEVFLEKKKLWLVKKCEVLGVFNVSVLVVNRTSYTVW